MFLSLCLCNIGRSCSKCMSTSTLSSLATNAEAEAQPPDTQACKSQPSQSLSGGLSAEQVLPTCRCSGEQVCDRQMGRRRGGRGAGATAPPLLKAGGLSPSSFSHLCTPFLTGPPSSQLAPTPLTGAYTQLNWLLWFALSAAGKRIKPSNSTFWLLKSV